MLKKNESDTSNERANGKHLKIIQKIHEENDRKSTKYDGKARNVTGRHEMTGKHEIRRESTKCDGKARNMTGKHEIRRKSTKYDGKPRNMTGNHEI